MLGSRTLLFLSIVFLAQGFPESFAGNFADCAVTFVDTPERRNDFYSRAPLASTMTFLRQIYESSNTRFTASDSVSDLKKIHEGAVLLLHEIGAISELLLTMRHQEDISLKRRLQDKLKREKELKVSALPLSAKEFPTESDMTLQKWFQDHFYSAFIFQRAEDNIRRGSLRSIEIFHEWREIKKAARDYDPPRTTFFFGEKKGPLHELVSIQRDQMSLGNEVISLYSLEKDGIRDDFVLATDPWSLVQFENGNITWDKLKPIFIHMQFAVN